MIANMSRRKCSVCGSVIAVDLFMQCGLHGSLVYFHEDCWNFTGGCIQCKAADPGFTSGKEVIVPTDYRSLALYRANLKTFSFILCLLLFTSLSPLTFSMLMNAVILWYVFPKAVKRLWVKMHPSSYSKIVKKIFG